MSRSFPALWYIQYSSIGESKNLQKVFVWLKLFPPKFSHGTKFPCTSARRQILYSSELWLQAWPVKAGVALCDLKIFFQLYSYLFVINSISIYRIYAFLFILICLYACACVLFILRFNSWNFPNVYSIIVKFTFQFKAKHVFHASKSCFAFWLLKLYFKVDGSIFIYQFWTINLILPSLLHLLFRINMLKDKFPQ